MTKKKKGAERDDEQTSENDRAESSRPSGDVTSGNASHDDRERAQFDERPTPSSSSDSSPKQPHGSPPAAAQRGAPSDGEPKDVDSRGDGNSAGENLEASKRPAGATSSSNKGAFQPLLASNQRQAPTGAPTQRPGAAANSNNSLASGSNASNINPQQQSNGPGPGPGPGPRPTGPGMRRPGMPGGMPGGGGAIMETRVSIRASRAPNYMFNENTDLMVIPPLRHILSKDQFKATLSVANKQLQVSKHTGYAWEYSAWSLAHRVFAILFYVIVVATLAVVLWDGQQDDDAFVIYAALAIDTALWVFINAKFAFTERRGRKICEKVAARAAEKLPGRDAGIIKVGCEWTGMDYVLQIDVRMNGRARAGPGPGAVASQQQNAAASKEE